MANLNQQIQESPIPGITRLAGGSARRRPDNLSGLIDTAVFIPMTATVSVTTTNGALLVVGNQSDALTTQLNSPQECTKCFPREPTLLPRIAGGQLQGLISARDGSIPSAQSSLDNLAAGLISAVNNQQECRLRPEWWAGSDFFTPLHHGHGFQCRRAATI